MAASQTRHAGSGIFWTKIGMDEEVSWKSSSNSVSSNNSTKMQARRPSDCHIDVPFKRGGKKQGYVQNDQYNCDVKKNASTFASIPTEKTTFPMQAPKPAIFESTTAQSQVGLKDLCPEDKRRIANLIEELARVSEEKEESVKRFQDEHDNFEIKIQHLEQQNLLIAHERESLQQQYRECQELLGLYQQYLTQQQIKLNQSNAELSQAHTDYKIQSSEEAITKTTGQANGLLFDGSYLSLAACQTHQPAVSRRSSGRREALEPATIPTPASYYSKTCPVDSGQHQIQTGESGLQQVAFQDSGYVTQQRRTKGHYLEKNCESNLSQRKHWIEQEKDFAAENKKTTTIPQLGSEDWEEKMHQLLLQKMQLEMEREKLQTRLADQEERLSRQNQQLLQSQLDCRRLDLSAVDLVDIFSSIPTHDQCKPSSCRPKSSQRGQSLTARKPICRTVQTPAVPYPPKCQQDLEESQILEDIFFIC
ncbi:protein hinderin isoform X3 [Corythoichthys intestinalis]|uniref:protein hinderin isoform X3 n=1 Tax=Corythoichthys intestinalis TaxID=161448 RepID=UPI0025A66856|nr:protein hinderin isoform X3 [Corythoichthys intestinalis]